MPGMIVAPQPIAVEEGAKVLMTGGNAVDAAVTCALIQAIVDPHMCGIGGYVLLNLHMQSRAQAEILDAPALAGSKVSSTMWQDRLIRPNPDGWGYFLKDKLNDLGYQAICTPGTVKALATTLERWGTISWEQAIAPAVHLAEEGFPVNRLLADSWKNPPSYPEASSLRDYLDRNAEARRIYLTDQGQTPEAGAVIRNPDYARTLRHLAEHGPDDFYHGSLADRMSQDLVANDSFVTAQDLAHYQVRHPEAVIGTYRDYTIATAPPPHGGPTLLAMLNILEGYDLSAMTHNSADYIYRVSMAMKAAFADRNPHMADPDFVEVPLDWMTSKERAEVWRRRIDAGEPIKVGFTPYESPDTTHVTVVDSEGNCAALTHSLGASSGVITPGLGFMYNNSMINFHPLPDHPNSIAPRKSRTTGMAPTLVYRDGQPILVVGAPGATRIITAILQVILNTLDFGMSIDAAVAAPRFDCQGDLIKCHARIPEYVCAAVRRKHPIQRLAYSYGSMALVHAISLDPQSGRLAGGADPGSDGMALEV